MVSLQNQIQYLFAFYVVWFPLEWSQLSGPLMNNVHWTNGLQYSLQIINIFSIEQVSWILDTTINDLFGDVPKKYIEVKFTVPSSIFIIALAFETCLNNTYTFPFLHPALPYLSAIKKSTNL